MAFTYCGSQITIEKAGFGVNGSAISGTTLQLFCDQAEGVINAASRYDWTSAYPALASGGRMILADAASNIAAIYCINYSMAGMPSRVEAEDRINVLRDSALRDISILRDKKTQQFILGDTN